MNIKKFLAPVIMATLMVTSTHTLADWGAPRVVIDNLFVYPQYVVVIQTPYAGTAGCNASGWSFSWSDFDPQTQQRIYGMLLAARIAQTPIQPVLTDTGCGPEDYKKFTGLFVL